MRKVRAGNGLMIKKSRHYDDKYWLYWWDITPANLSYLDEITAIEFVQKDTGVVLRVDSNSICKLLTKERQTTRSGGNWGIRILKHKPNQLALESPGLSHEEWPILRSTRQK